MPAIEFVFTKPVCFIYTNSLIAPVAFKDKNGVQGNPRFNTQMLIASGHIQLAEIKDCIMRAAAAELPGRDLATINLPLKSGDKLNAERQAQGKEPRDFYRDVMVLFAQKPEKSRAGALLNPPHLVVLQNGKYVEYADAQRPLVKDFFYSGVQGVASVQFKGFTGFGGGVTCYLDRLVSLNTGERISVGRDDEDVFGSADSYAEYVGHVSAESVVPQQGAASPW